MSRFGRHNWGVFVLLRAVVFVLVLGEVARMACIRNVQNLSEHRTNALVSVFQR